MDTPVNNDTPTSPAGVPREPDFAAIIKRVERLEKWAHEPYDFTHLIRRLEALEGTAGQAAQPQREADANVAAVRAKLLEREQRGLAKYGKPTSARDDLEQH